MNLQCCNESIFKISKFKVQMSKSKCQINVQAQMSKEMRHLFWILALGFDLTFEL